MTARKPVAKAAVDPKPATFKTDVERGDLVTYVVDDGGHERTETGIVTELFKADGVVHARVAHLPAPLAVDVADLTL